VFAILSCCNEFTNSLCIWCHQPFHTQFLPHLQECKARAEVVANIQPYDLTPLQQRALFETYKTSATRHLLSWEETRKKLLAENYSADDLATMSNFIERKAPLIIHIKLGQIISSLNSDC
jgi:hypothetical protein